MGLTFSEIPSPLIYYGGNTSLSDYHNILETYNENSYQAILPKETVCMGCRLPETV